MKAVIVEIRGKYAAALFDDGCVKKLINHQYAIGQEIEIKTIKKTPSKLLMRVASAAAIFVITGFSAWAYYTPYSYVSLDVNPSVEYSLNRFDYVLDYTAVNDDGKKILEELHLKNKNIKTAIKATVEEIASQGYFPAEETGGIVIAASSEDDKKSEKLAHTLKVAAKETTDAQDLAVEVESEGVGKDQVEEAKALGVTPGRLNLVKKLQESAPDETKVNVEEWLKKPVKEIMKQAIENKKSEEKNHESQTSQTEKDSNGAQNQEKDTKDTKDEKDPKDKDAKDNSVAQPRTKDDGQTEKNNGKEYTSPNRPNTAPQGGQPENSGKDNSKNGQNSSSNSQKDKSIKNSSNSKLKISRLYGR